MNALKLYSQWNDKRLEKWAAWWEPKRARGKNHYVRWVTLLWSGAMLNFHFLWNIIFGRGFEVEQFLYSLPLNLIGGWLFGLYSWWSNEKEYRKYLAGAPERQLKQ